jgi:hypothetical protein
MGRGPSPVSSLLLNGTPLSISVQPSDSGRFLPCVFMCLCTGCLAFSPICRHVNPIKFNTTTFLDPRRVVDLTTLSVSSILGLSNIPSGRCAPAAHTCHIDRPRFGEARWSLSSQLVLLYQEQASRNSMGSHNYLTMEVRELAYMQILIAQIHIDNGTVNQFSTHLTLTSQVKSCA